MQSGSRVFPSVSSHGDSVHSDPYTACTQQASLAPGELVNPNIDIGLFSPQANSFTSAQFSLSSKARAKERAAS